MSGETDLSNQVANVLSGKSALNATPLKKPVSFKKTSDSEEALVKAYTTLRNDLKDSIQADDDQQATALISKLASYASKKGWKSGEDIDKHLGAELPTIGDALRGNIKAITSRAGISGILDRHTQQSRQAAADLRKNKMPDPMVGPELVFNVGDHKLVELKTPAHLRQDSAELGHCVGTLYNENALEDKGLKKGDEGAEEYLHYAIKLRNGESRIFSLRDQNDTPLATIEYKTDTKSIGQIDGARTIDQIEGTTMINEPKTPFFNDLTESIYQLGKQLDLSGGIDYLSPVGDNMILTRHGQQPYAESNIADENEIYTGTIILTNDMDPKEIETLSRSSGITFRTDGLNSEEIDALLPSEIKASIQLSGETDYELKSLKKVGTITGRGVESLILPSLEEAGTINVPDATTLEVPALEKSGDIEARRVTVFEAPALEIAGEINANSATTFKSNALKRAEGIFSSEATVIEIAVLEKVGEINANKTTILEAPALKESKSIDAHNAITLKIPALEQAENIDATNATTFEAPSLRLARDINARNATTFKTPSLENANFITADGAISVDVSALEEVLSFNANSATTFEAPTLKSGSIRANNVTSFKAPVLIRTGDIDASNATTFEIPVLEQAENIDASSTSFFEAPALKTARNINASNATTFKTPSLEKVRNINAPNAANFEVGDSLSAHLIIKPNTRDGHGH